MPVMIELITTTKAVSIIVVDKCTALGLELGSVTVIF